MDSPQLDPKQYTVLWIAPLEVEAQAAFHMLDDKHTGKFGWPRRGQRFMYFPGKIHGRNVVIGTFPSGQAYGTGAAAALATDAIHFFPNIKIGLLVGVAAGVPHPERDIRLGDVLVAVSENGKPAVVNYELGKETSKGLELLNKGHVLTNTDQPVRVAITDIKAKSPWENNVFLAHFEKMKHESRTGGNFLDPGEALDQLYEKTSTGADMVVPRPQRNSRTIVWYGSIGSGDKLMKNALKRNDLRDRYDIIGLEMEAAGVMSCLDVGVIRGVCDYGDEHKNKEWQPYAAAMAAAYAKEILCRMPPVSPDLDPYIRTPIEARFNEHPGSLSSKSPDRMLSPAVRGSALPPSPVHSSSDVEMDEGHQRNIDRRQDRLQDLEAPEEIEWPEIRNERPAQASRFLHRSDFPGCLEDNGTLWQAKGRQSPWILVIHGLPGVGKSQICLEAIADNEDKFRGVFYIDANSATTANSSYLDISKVSGTLIDCPGMSSEKDISEQISRTRVWMSNLKDPWLLFIDNVEPSMAAHLKDYIPHQGCGSVIITTIDRQLASSYDASWEVKSMSQGDANTLLHSFVAPDEVFEDDDWIDGDHLAWTLLGGLPLAIVQAGSCIPDKLSVTEYTQRFEQSSKLSLPVWHSVDGQKRSVQNALELTMISLQATNDGSDLAVELLRTLCFFHHEAISEQIFEEAWINLKQASSEQPEQVSCWSALVPLIDTSSSEWRTPSLHEAFGTLGRYSLLVCDASYPRRYSINKLVQAFYRGSLSIEDQTKYAFRAAALSALALSNVPVSTTVSRTEDPSGLDLQKALIPHIEVFASANVVDCWLKLAQAEKCPPYGLEIMRVLANAYASTGHFEQALQLLEKAHVVCASCLVSEPLALRIKEQFADCLTRTGRHSEALALQRGVIGAQQRERPDINSLWSTLMHHADSLWITGRQSEALSKAHEALALCLSNLHFDDPKLVRTRMVVADFLHGSGSKRQALELRQQTVRDLQTDIPVTKKESLRILEAKSALADSYDWDGRLRRSLRLREKVYKRMVELLSVDHPHSLCEFDRLLDTKSLLSYTLPQKENLCSLRRDAVASWKRVRGDNHPQTLEARVNLGHSYAAASRLKEALSEQQDVLKIRRLLVQGGADPVDMYDSVGNVAHVLLERGRFQEAHELLRSELKSAKAVPNLDAQVLFTLRSDYQTVLSHQGKAREALNLRRQLLKDQEATFGKRDVRTHQTQLLLAMDLAKLHRYSEAIQVHQELLDRQRADLGEDNQETLNNMKELASVLTADKQESQAAALLDKVAHVEIDHLGPDHPQTRDTAAEAQCLYEKVGTPQAVQAAFQLMSMLNIRPFRGVRTGSNGEHHGDADSSDEEMGNTPEIRSNRRELTPGASPSRSRTRQAHVTQSGHVQKERGKGFGGLFGRG